MAQSPRQLDRARIAQNRRTRASDQRSEISARHIRLLSTLQDVLSAIAGKPDIESELQPLVASISSRFRYANVAIGIIEGEEIVFRGATSSDRRGDFRLPITQGICGRVARSGVAELVTDLAADPDYVGVINDSTCEACVPIHAGNTVWGVLNVEAARDVTLEAEEFEILMLLAASLGQAIERSRRQRAGLQQHDQLAHLQRLAGRIAGRVDAEQGAEDVLTEIRRVFGYSALGLGVVRDGKFDVYHSYAALLDGSQPLRTIPMTGVSGKVARTGEPVFARNVHDEPEYVNTRPDTTQEICVPVRSGDMVVGVLNVEATDERTLDNNDLDLLLTLGDHLGSAISNHLRIAELERRNQQLRLVDRVTSLIAGQITIREALPHVLAEIEGAFGYGSSGIGLIDGDRLVFAAVRDSHEDNIHDYFLDHGVSIETGVTGLVARTGQPVFIKDVSASPDYLPTSPVIQQEICVPISAHGQVIGVLNVETPSSKPLEQSDFEILTTIANHLGMAFERSEAYEAERRSRTAMEAIQRVATIVSSTLDSDEALRRIVEMLATVFGYSYVSISLIDGEQLDSTAWHGLPDGSVPPPFVVGAGVAGRVAQTGIAELVDLFTADEESSIARADTTSQIVVPIRCSGELAGVISVEGTEQQP
ncbi:MAG TPA: GAF domain-containing protein, partial [Thermomicrobiales bacterium]|nr:GAF domain-containing protein [Thermomicrobiales bacterium]